MANISFTEEEKSTIVSITNKYATLMKESIALQHIIEDAEGQLRFLAQNMEHLQETEHHFFFDLGAKYDLEAKTIQTAAANYIMSNNQENEISK
jgi:hypothetical protein